MRKNNVLITGALSEIAVETIFKLLEKKHSNFILCDVLEKEKHLNELKQHILKSSDYDCEVIVICFDATNIEETQEILENIELGIDEFYNFIGTNMFKGFLEIKESDWDKILDINLKSAFFLCQSVARNMRKYNIKGRIVLISSQHGIVANGLRSPYCVSKAGIIHLTKVLALELSSYKIRVNCVSPTYVYAEKSKEFLNNENVKREYLTKIPLQSYALPKDVANACVYLADENNHMVTGNNILVDGGYTIW